MFRRRRPSHKEPSLTLTGEAADAIDSTDQTPPPTIGTGPVATTTDRAATESGGSSPSAGPAAGSGSGGSGGPRADDSKEGSAMNSTKSSAPGFVPEIPRRPIDLPGAPKRPSAAQPRSGSAAAAGESKKLVVGREISLSGEITACESLIVEGSVQATLENSRYLEIAESGLFKGRVTIEEAVIAGHFDGTLVVRDRLFLKASGRISGEVRFGKLEVELGGEIVGTIETLSDADRSDAADGAIGDGIPGDATAARTTESGAA